MSHEEMDDRIRELRYARPFSVFVHASLWLFGLLLVAAWFVHDFHWDEAFSAEKVENLERLGRDIRPKPVRDGDWDWGKVAAWVEVRMGNDDEPRSAVTGGTEALVNTVAISLLAIVLAAIAAMFLSLPAARNLMARDAFGQRNGLARRDGRVLVGIARTILVLLRCLPEYMLAFFFLAIFGLSAWPAVLALAIHNAGILGRLNAETIENVRANPARALRAGGAPRRAIVAYAIFPSVLPRFLLYFFARWETCVREATVLGLLSLPALGRLIQDAKTRFRYDQMLFFVLLGVGIVVIGDLVSAWLRRFVRRGT